MSVNRSKFLFLTVKRSRLLFLKSAAALFFLSFTLVLTGCLQKFQGSGFWEKKVDVEPISRAIINYAVKLKHEKGLRFEDSQVFYGDFVEGIRIIFSTQAILELKETRQLIVDVMEELLRIFNENPAIASQLECGEISANQIDLYISFESYFVEYVDQEYMAWAFVHDGITRFYSGTIKYPYNDYWHARTEPYYKSLEFVTFEREAESSYDVVFPPKKGQGTVYDVLIE